MELTPKAPLGAPGAGSLAPPVTLHPFGAAHLPRLADWLRRAHVARWFPDPEGNLAWAANPPAGGFQAVIAWGDVEAGYLRWQHVDRATLDGVDLPEIPENSVDVDILLGDEAHVGKGLGPSALRILVATLREDPSVPLVGLTTSIANVSARRAYEKAGFRVARQYSPAPLGPCHLMVVDLRGQRAGAVAEPRR